MKTHCSRERSVERDHPLPFRFKPWGGGLLAVLSLTAACEWAFEEHPDTHLQTASLSSARPPLDTEWFVPEYHRRRQLSLNDDFDFEDCEFVDAHTVDDRLRPRFIALGEIGSRMNRPVADVFSMGFRPGLFSTCAAEDCYLRVSTVNLEKEVVIKEDGLVEFETLTGTERVDFRLREAGGHRGAIVFARKIKIQGNLRLGSANLVLVARDGVDMSEGTIFAHYPRHQRVVESAYNLDENPDGYRCEFENYGAWYFQDPENCARPLEAWSNERNSTFPRLGETVARS